MWNRKATEIHAKLVSSDAAFASQESEQELEHQMQIQHTTYDELHQPSSGRRTSTNDKVKHYISGLVFSSDSNTDDKDTSPRSIKVLWRGSGTNSGRRRSSTGFKKPWSSKDRRNSEIQESQAIPTGGDERLPVKSLKRGTDQQDETTVYIAPRKRNLYNTVKEKWHRRISTSLQSSGDQINQEPSMEKIFTLRKRIHDGKMERVIRPPSPSSYHKTHTPPRPPPNLSYNRPVTNLLYGAPPKSLQPLGVSRPTPSPRQSSEALHIRLLSQNRKTKSGSSALTLFLGTGADALDQTRRELQGKFKEPFEHLSYGSFPRKQSKERDEDGSDESFYCAGEEETANRGNGLARRAEGKRMSASSGIAARCENKRCELCGEPGVKAPRNLCAGCEAELMKRKERSRSRTPSPRSQAPTDYRPTPPPKDNRFQPLLVQTRPREVLPTSRYHQSLKSPGIQSKPSIPHKSTSRYSMTFMGQSIVAQLKPYSLFSQLGKTEIENGDADAEVGYNGEMGIKERINGDEVEKAQTLFKRWLEDEGGDEEDEGGGRSESERAECMREKNKRDTELYGYWDDLFDGTEGE